MKSKRFFKIFLLTKTHDAVNNFRLFQFFKPFLKGLFLAKSMIIFMVK